MTGSEGVMIKIRVQPKASKDEIVGWDGSALKIRVVAPPVEGEANKAVISLLAKRLKVAKSAISITSGQNSRIKTVFLSGLTEQEIRSFQWDTKKH